MGTPAHPTDDELAILEKFGAQYDVGTLLLTAREYWREYVVDSLAFEAKLRGVSRAEYVEYMNSCGLPLCGARTKRGTLCCNSVAGWRDHPNWSRFERWKELHRTDYCRVHGGG